MHGGSICQSRFICQVWCTGILGIYSQFTGGGSISQIRFICQVLCIGKQGIFGLLPRGVHLPKYVCLPSFVYWYSSHHCSISGGGPSAKVCLSAKFCVLVFKASMLFSLGGQLAKVGSSAKFCVLVFSFLLLGVHLPK